MGERHPLVSGNTLDELRQELRRMAVREGRDQAKVSAILDAVLTYDHRLGEAARSAGIDAIAPGPADTP